MEESEIKISILILMGLPGSGKTTFSQYLQEHLENLVTSSPSYSPIHVMCVCYDRIIMKDGHENSEIRWSEARKNVMKDVESVIEKLKNNPSELDEEPNIKFLPKERSRLKHSRLLIVIDDNMYYRSMRYQYYQVARRNHTGFCQLYMKCDVKECLRRNALRNFNEIIHEDIIEKMALNLEEPDVHENEWEIYSCAISSDNLLINEKIQTVCQMIEESFFHPVEPLPCTYSETARAICFSNVLHQVDIILRKLVGNQIKQSKDNLSKKQVQSLCKTLNTERQNILEGIKSGNLNIPENICTAINEGQIAALPDLHSFLSLQFSKDQT